MKTVTLRGEAGRTASLFFALCLGSLTAAVADTLIVLDNSGSMSSRMSGGGSKTEEARRAITDSFLPALPKEEKAALWAFGGGCSGFQIQGRFGTGQGTVGVELTRVGHPSGSTPLARSVAAALDELSHRPKPRHLIVITDGYDTCGGDPCAEVRRATAAGARVSVHTVGLGMGNSSGDFRMLQCMADASSGGSAHAIDQSAGPGAFQDILGKIARQLEEPKGALTVELRDAAGSLQNGVGYVVEDAKGGELRGTTGEPLALTAGTYRLRGLGGRDRTVQIAVGQPATVEVSSPLGRLVARLACPPGGSFIPTTSFALLDSAGSTVRTGGLGDGLSLDLPPGTYRLALTQFVPLPPVDVQIVAASLEQVDVPGLGSLEVAARDAAGRPVTLPLEVFDDNSRSSSRPVATGQTNEAFLLPAGIYNVRVSADDPRGSLFRGGDNVRVHPCTQSSSYLEQRAALLICRPGGSFSAWNDVTGQQLEGEAGTELAVAPGIYNLRLADGRRVANVRVERGVVRIGCE